MNIDLNELTNAGIVDDATADAIKSYYALKKKTETGSRFFQIISILGIILIALGIILIIGYRIPKWAKVIVGFIPLLIAQVIGMITLYRNKKSGVWSEISATSILAGIAIAMSLLSSIYNMDATYSEFLKWGLCLCIPVVLLFDSAVASLISWIGIGIYITSGPNYQHESKSLITLGFMAALLYLYVKHILRNNLNLAWAWHHIAIPIVLLLFTFSLGAYSCQILVLLHLLVIFFAFSTISSVKSIADRMWIDTYRIVAFGGTFILAFIYSFKNFWTQPSFHFTENCFTREGIITTISFTLLFGAVILYLIKTRSKDLSSLFDIKWILLILGLLTLMGNSFPDFSRAIVNILILLSCGILIKEGINTENILQLNLGILLLAIWVTCRFFGTDIPSIWKGILFILLGLLCFFLNYSLLKKKRS
jgi:uncharacterized membrane protein